MCRYVLSGSGLGSVSGYPQHQIASKGRNGRNHQNPPTLAPPLAEPIRTAVDVPVAEADGNACDEDQQGDPEENPCEILHGPQYNTIAVALCCA